MYFELFSSPSTFVTEKINNNFIKMVEVFDSYFFPNYFGSFCGFPALFFLSYSFWAPLDCQIPGSPAQLIDPVQHSIVATALERLKH